MVQWINYDRPNALQSLKYLALALYRKSLPTSALEDNLVSLFHIINEMNKHIPIEHKIKKLRSKPKVANIAF